MPDTENAPIDSPMSEDELFDHLQELVDELPCMQVEGDRLAKARAAREVLKRERYHEGQEHELALVQNDFDAQLAAARAAQEAGDVESQDNARYNSLVLGNQLGVRRGAEADAARKVAAALEEGGFADLEEARAAALSDEEFAALEQSVESFKADYVRTLEACQAIEDAEEEEGAADSE